MAAGISSAGQLTELIGLARRRVWQVLLPAVLTGSLGVMAGSLLPAKYTAETFMELATVPPPLEQAGLTAVKLRDRMVAAEASLKHFDSMNEVLTELDWEHYETLPPDERREFVRKLNKDLWVLVTNPPGTSLHVMQFGYRDTDPQRAAQFANHLRDYFSRGLIEGVSEDAIENLSRLRKELALLEEAYESSSGRIEELRKDNKISPTQTFGDGSKERETDPLYVALTNAQTDLGRLETEIRGDEQMFQALKQARQSMPTEVLESETEIGGVENSDAIVELRQRISTAKLQQINLKATHSVYQRAQREIEQCEASIAVLEGRSIDATLVQKKVPNPAAAAADARIAELELELTKKKAQLASVELAIADLEPKVADRVLVYSEFQKESDNYEMLRERRKSLITLTEVQESLVNNLSLPDFSPFEVVQEALPPTKPSSPSALLVVAGGLILGLALGVLWALVAEFGRNAYRSPGDLSRALPAPVLGAINEIVTVQERRERAFRSGLVGAATLILSASVLWVTWAFHARPGLLGPELTSWIDGVRGQLR